MTDTRRLFFALPLPETLRQEVIEWRAAQFPAETGRPVSTENLHLTLAFLGEVSANKEQALRAAAAQLQQSAFTLTLDDYGHWPRPGVVWLGLRNPPQGLLQLAQWLREQAARNGCYQSPMPYYPHISLLRQAFTGVSSPAGTPGWQTEVTAFNLYHSAFENGRTHYILLESWPLKARS